MVITTRNWRASDLNAVHTLNQHNQPNVNSLTFEKLQSMAEACACFPMVELDNQFAGFVLTFLPNADYDCENLYWFNQRYRDFLYLDRVAIADFAKQRGCASALYKEVENYCKNKGIGNIALEVNIRPRNQASLDFHQKMGFVEVGTQDTGGGEKTVSLMMKAV